MGHFIHVLERYVERLADDDPTHHNKRDSKSNEQHQPQQL